MLIRDRIKELRRVKASDLSPSPKNWRTHPQGQVDALAGVLEEIGYADALLARELPDGTLQLVDGHCRREISADEEVPVLVLDLDEHEADKLMTLLDPLAAMAEANTEALGKLLHDVETDNAAVQEMLDGLARDNGIDLFEAGGEEEAPEAQVDRADELREEWKTEAGQLWVITGKAGEHRLLCGDSTKREDVERVGPVAVVITDPPYGIADAPIQGQGRTGKRCGKVNTWHPESEWDKELRPEYCEAATQLADIIAWFGHWRQRETVAEFMGLPLRAEIVWAKDCHVGPPCPVSPRDERIWLFSKNGIKARTHETSVWDEKMIPTWNHKHHKNEKPTTLMARLIQLLTDKSQAVGDPFLGSGTTMVAAERLGRVCHGIEIEPKYVAVCLQRMRDMDLTPRLSDG